MQMENGMTVLSGEMYKKATESNLTIGQATQLLINHADFRSLSDKLNHFAQGRDLRKILTEGLIENHPEKKRETIDRNIRNWLGNHNDSIKKDLAIELCFILGLNFEQSDEFLALISQELFHWRHPDEIPYIFALKNGLTYKQATSLHRKLKIKLDETHIRSTDEPTFTDIIKDDIQNIQTEEDLMNYVVSQKANLGKMHNTAYSSFCEMLDVLESPATDLQSKDNYFPKDEKYSVGRIVAEYMHRGDIPEIFFTRQKDFYSALQRDIALNWPSEYTISRMINRHIDVTRKVLMLLFLATYDGADDDYDYNPDASQSNADENFNEFYKRMNALLVKCGFSKIDLRSAFDWMIVFCMCTEDIYKVDDRLSKFLKIIFKHPETDCNIE